jgi:ketosteroid isomerase-like protein
MAPTRRKVARFITITIGCIGLAASTLACSKLPAENTSSQNERTQAQAAIRQQDDAWLKAIGAKQLDATVSYYGNGAVLLAPNAPIARTKDEIRQTWSQFFASIPAGARLSGGTTQVEVANSGDMAYTVGFYTVGNPPIDKGKYLEVWKKQPDGSWKAIVDTFNSDMPAPPPAR